MIKVAQYAAQLEDYEKAYQIYEQVKVYDKLIQIIDEIPTAILCVFVIDFMRP